MSIYVPGFDGDILVATNVDFSLPTGQAVGQMQSDGQLLIGNTAGPQKIKTGVITSPSGTITIGYADPNITIDLAGGGIAFDEIIVQAVTAPGVSPVTPTAGGALTLSGATVAAGVIPVQSRSIALNQLQIEVQRASSSAATNATQQGLASFNNTQFSVDANGWVNIIPGAGVLNITPDTGVNVTNSAFTLSATAVAAAGFPIRTNGLAANSLQIQSQRASASAATNATAQGLASFNNAHFSVDANGWVSNLNGVPISSIDVQNAVGPGVDPVLPSAAGVVQVNGTIVAAQNIPIRTNSLALNAYNIETQYSSAQAVDTPTASGMCHFDSAQFTVSATGFVQSLASVAFVWQDSGPVAMANFNGYFATGAGAYTLPLGVNDGETIEIVDQVGGGVVVTAAGAQVIQIGNVLSSAGGTATSTQSGDSIRAVYRASAGRWVCVPGVNGNWLLA